MTEQSTAQELCLPEGYTARVLRRDDAQGVTDLINATDVAMGAPAETSAAETAEQWAEPDFDMVHGAWIIEDEAGVIVGYEECQDEHHNGNIWLDGYVHPNHLGRGLGTYLLRLGEKRGRELANALPENVRAALIVNCFGSDQAAIDMFTVEGFHTERHYWRMEIEMGQAPDAPVLPTGIQIRPFVMGQDDRATHAAVTEAFLDHWGSTPRTFEEWASGHIGGEGFDPTLWLLAVDQASSEIAGFSLCKLRGGESAWVNTLGVRRAWRKHGLGMALLQHSFGEFYRRGFRQVGLGVDTENPTGATRLYERAGMRPVQRYDRFIKVLRESVTTA